MCSGVWGVVGGHTMTELITTEGLSQMCVDRGLLTNVC